MPTAKQKCAAAVEEPMAVEEDTQQGRILCQLQNRNLA